MEKFNREYYDLIKSFEDNFPPGSINTKKYDEDSQLLSNNVYCNGLIDNLFKFYVLGYFHGKL